MIRTIDRAAFPKNVIPITPKNVTKSSDLYSSFLTMIFGVKLLFSLLSKNKHPRKLNIADKVIPTIVEFFNKKFHKLDFRQ